jgi:hypothetical protein
VRLLVPIATANTRHVAPALIGAGLAILIAYIPFPVLPVATATSLVALGATFATLTSIGSMPASRVRITVHLFVYASLYLLLIGAIGDAASRAPKDGLSLPQIVDLGLGTGIMAFVVQMCIAAIADDRDAATR